MNRLPNCCWATTRARSTDLFQALQPYVGYSGSGAETRGRSALDMALHDLVGRATGIPIHQMLGGLARNDIRVYNTCAGYRDVRSTPRQEPGNWGIGGSSEGPYEDLEAFLSDAGALAESLLSEGITGMKIWPFDFAAERTGGFDISPAEMIKAIDPFRKIRAAVGDRIDIMCELHGLFSPPTAARIAHAPEPFRPFWIEDPVRDGVVSAPDGAGLGTRLKAGTFERPDANVRSSAL
ncbi:MAG: enolase C-terminal domain-like protein [Minwuia sp.]|nr:enolase C-terminal domain-like protein [Minwuia sp.]